MSCPSAAPGPGAPAGRDASPAPHRRRVYLHPSRMFVSTEPHEIVTILGSCVAVCLWDRRRGTGGINHYLLPLPVRRDDRSGRFGVASIRLLLERLLALGCRAADLEAKVFGGACMMKPFRGTSNDLGRKNSDVAFRMLEERGIPVVAEDVGGDRGRRLLFQTDDGHALVRRL